MFFKRRRELERQLTEMRAEIVALKSAPPPEQNASLAAQLVESMGSILASQAQQQPALTQTLFEHVGKMMDLVRRDAMRASGSEGGKRSGAARKKKAADQQALAAAKAMAEGCAECSYNLHGIPWHERGNSVDYMRHKAEGHDLKLADLEKVIAPNGRGQAQ